MVITRAQFQEAIEYAIEKAPSLTPEHIESLRRVGELSDEFGLYFSTNCPAAQAGIYVADIEPPSDNFPSIEFAYGFDDYLYEHLVPEEDLPAVVQVRS